MILLTVLSGLLHAPGPSTLHAQDAPGQAAPESPGIVPPGYVPCQRLDSLLKIIIGQRNLGYFADAIDNTGTVHMWFMSRERREWTAITVDRDLTACIIAQGTDWHFALEPAPTPSPARRMTLDQEKEQEREKQRPQNDAVEGD